MPKLIGIQFIGSREQSDGDDENLITIMFEELSWYSLQAVLIFCICNKCRKWSLLRKNLLRQERERKMKVIEGREKKERIIRGNERTPL